MKKLIILTVVYMMLSLASFAQNHKRPDSYNYNRAVEAIQNNNVEEALDYLKKELSDAPKNGYAYSWLAYVRENQDEYGMALSTTLYGCFSDTYFNISLDSLGIAIFRILRVLDEIWV